MIFENIRNLREDNDKTQQELANYLNVKQTTYSKYELGKINIPIEVFIKLADYYNVTVDYLLDRDKKVRGNIGKEHFTEKKYGHIEVTLRKYMHQKQIKRNALANAVNTHFDVIDKWYSGHIEKIDADILARICFSLNCEPGDIIKYVKE